MDETHPTHREAESAPRTARIQDVARLAEVSTATVSRALATPDRVSPQARARVLEAIAKVGYVPNPAARSLRSQKTHMVLVVLPTLENIFFAKVLRGIEETLFEAGYGMIIGDLDGSPDKEAHFAAFVAAGQVDGALFLNGHLFAQNGEIMPGRPNVPLVALCEAIPDADIPQIEVDNRAAASGMTAYLASLGHRRIGYLCGPGGNVLERDRIQGYRDGLSGAGIPFDPDLVWPGDYTLEAGVRAGRDISARNPDRRPSAVFSSNDEMAVGLLQALAATGIRVPEDISVAGFDDIELAAVVQPALTTIRQPRREIGQTAALVLVDLLRGKPVQDRVRLPTELVVRDSTGPARTPG